MSLLETKVTVAYPLLWFVKGVRKAESYQMVPYRLGMNYFDDPEENKKAKTFALYDVVEAIQTSPLAKKRCAALRRPDVPEADKKHIKMTGLNRLFWGEFDLTEGKFTDASLKTHPGVMCFDIDKISETQAFLCKKVLQDDPYCVLAFISPRGEGVKFLIRTPAVVDQHPMRYAGIKARYERLLGHPIDPTGSNPARACFVSHDPTPVVNWEAEICMDYIEPKVQILPSGIATEEAEEAYLRATKRVTEIKEKDWKEGGKHAFLISLCGMCKAFGIDETTFRSLGAEYIIDDLASKSVTKLYTKS